MHQLEVMCEDIGANLASDSYDEAMKKLVAGYRAVRSDPRGMGVEELELDPTDHGTYLMRRTKATLTYRTKNVRAVHLLLGRSSWSRLCAISAPRSTTPWKIPKQTEI